MKTSITAIHKLLIAALMLAPLVGRAQEISASALQQIGALIAEKDSRSPAEQKMDSQLIYLAAQAQGQSVVNGVPNLQVAVEVAADNRVLVDISGTVSADLTDAIIQAGGEIVNQFAPFDAIRARLPVASIEALAGRADVRSIGPAAQAITNMGSVINQADRTHKADLARTTLGVTGNGIKIGVLSDGVNSLGLSINNGNINANAVVLAGQAGSGDEGTAMMELIQDLVPGAQLYFATAFNGNASFAANIIALQAAGCSIIVDDVGYFNESPFQDQVISQAVNTVSAAGAMYFSSAGNSGNKNDGTSGTWEGDFVSGGAVAAPVTGAGNLLDFGGGTTFNTVAAGGSSRRVDLFWSDPDLGSANDYDLFVLNSAGTSVLRSSTNLQTGTQSPYEATGTLNVGERIVIVQRAGAANRFIQLTTGRAVLTLSTNGVVRGHNAVGAANAFCVAATNVANSPSPNAFVGGATNPVETFSSDGPRRVFFDPSGTAITPGNFSSTGGQLLNKPDITAADGVSTSVTGFTTFFGTSAAAPHAAAIAALLKSYKPSLTPAQIRTAMTSTALDIEAVGADRDSGAGIAMAQAALASVAVPDLLTVTTSGDLNATGNVGGPFTPTSVTYTLTNTSGSPVNWTAAKTQGWVDLSPTSGTLAPAANVVLTCSINAVAAAALPGGAYSDAVTITNTTSGFSRKLAVNLVASVPVPASMAYSNITTFSGQGFINGSAASTATGTRLVADDITCVAGTAGRSVTNFVFSVANFDVASFSARPLVRFWAADGAGGGPGTYINGFNFNPITFGAFSVSTFNFSPSAGLVVIPAGEKIWAGITFDGNSGSTATLAQLNNLGQGIYNPPTVGSSADTMFVSTASGSNAVSNPAGSFSSFGGAPLANFGWQFSVATAPAVTTAAPASLAATSATLGGNVVSSGGLTVTDRGIVWSLAANPTTADTKVANGTGVGSFSATVTGLPALTTIHVRAYAINTVGTSYGADFTLTTPSANADLSNLVLTTATLDSAFASGTTSYTSTVPNSTTSLTVTPTAAQANATITVNGSPVTSGSPSGSIALSVGLNTITTVVTAQDTTTTKTYTVDVTRQASSLLVYTATLNGPNESPPNASPGTGAATVTINPVAHTMRLQTTFSGLTGTTTAAHIHGPTAVAGTGTAGVATTTPSFVGFPLGVTAGSMDQTYDLTLASSYNPAFVTANGGTPASAETALLAAIAAGKAYFNIHSTTFGGGEIRGFFSPPPPSGLVFTGVPITTQSGDYTAGGNDLPTRELSGFTPTPGQSYPYIEVTGAANSIIGTFNDLPDGGVVAMNFNGVIYYFQVNYHGGTDGNDLIFTNLLSPGPANWKWTAGPDSHNAVAIFGTEDVGADVNNPGARQGAMNWRAPNGNLWMFGGYGYASALTNPPRYLNDLWEYDRVTGRWIWHSGAQVHNQFGTYGSITVSAAANTPGSRHTGTSWADSSGNLWLFGGYGFGASGTIGRLNDLWRFNISSGQWTWMKGSSSTGAAGVYSGGAATLTPGARQGATSWATAGGNLYLFGGTSDGGSTFHNDLWLYTTGTGNWSVVKGNATTNINGTYTGAAAALTPGSRRDATGWVAKDGTLWLFGGLGLAETGATLGDMSDLWSFNTTTGNWTHVSGPTTQGATGTYTAPGSVGTPAARSAGSGWVTVDGDFWLVGGFKNSRDSYNDVWIYDIGTNTWTWKLGSSSLNAAGSYGTLGVAAPGNQPGARFTPSTWVTLNGAIWVFGGGGIDKAGNGGRLSDLWRYGIATPAGAPPEPAPAPFPDGLIVNSDPNANDAAAGTMAYVPVAGQLTGSDADGDHLLFLSSSPTTLSQGTLTLNPDGTWSYSPAPGFVGQSTFQFRAADAYGGSSPVRTLVITVVTNPADSDNDGIADSYEQTYLGGTGADALGDADADGQSNYFEYLAGTSPVDAAQSLSTAPSIASSQASRGSFKLDLNHVRPGVNYHLETSTDLDVWSRIGTFTFSVSGSATIEDPTPPTAQPAFYRISLEASTLLP